MMKERSDKTIEKARALRKNLAPAEKLLWKELRGRRFAGFKFRRQHPEPPFIVDFYCADCSLVIELDGESHLVSQEKDKSRQGFLERKGLLVLRFWNTEVFDELEPVLEKIYQTCCQRFSPHPQTGLMKSIEEKPKMTS